MIPRKIARDLPPEIYPLINVFSLISDKIIRHINDMDSKLKLREPVSLFSITRVDNFYQIDLMSELLEKQITRWLNKHHMPFQFGRQGIFIAEEDFAAHLPTHKQFHELIQQIDDALHAPTVEENKPESPKAPLKLFDQPKPLIKQVYVGWAQQQKEANQRYSG